MAQREQRVTPLELFFDLVFVYAITQVTQLMSHDPTWRGVARGVLVLAALWWAWTGYAWLTNRSSPRRARSVRACSERWLRCSSSRSPSLKRSNQMRCCSGSPT
jgi:low temperature requirement protein LtrA